MFARTIFFLFCICIKSRYVHLRIMFKHVPLKHLLYDFGSLKHFLIDTSGPAHLRPKASEPSEVYIHRTMLKGEHATGYC
jgi:hypothetical protein